MGTVITRSAYKGWPSLVMETTNIRIELVPELGGKIVSMLHKPNRKEWLVNSAERPLKRVEYGSSFTDADMSGWDECFPTIDACRYPGRENIELPDHGELWSVPWQWTLDNECIRLTVEGKSLPYSFSRTLSCIDDSKVRMQYEVVNHADEPLQFLWAAHPQFMIDEPTRIILPRKLDRLFCVYDGEHLNEVIEYPVDALEPFVIQPQSETISQSTGPSATVNARNARKFYSNAITSGGLARLQGELTDSHLTCSTSVGVPYMGIWIDEGKFNDRTICALEPAIGYYDNLERAIDNGTAGVIQPRVRKRWHLELTFG